MKGSLTRERKWILIGWALLKLILTFGTEDLWAGQTDQIEKDLYKKKRELEKISKDIIRKRAKEREIQEKESSTLKKLRRADTELRQKERELKKTKTKSDEVKSRLRKTHHHMNRLNQKIDQTRKKLNSRLKTLYMMEKVPLEASLSSSESYTSLLRADKYLRTTIASDINLINTFRYQMALTARDQEDLKRAKLRWDRNIREREKKKKEIRTVKAREQTRLHSIQHQKLASQMTIGEMEKRAKTLQTLIDKLEKEKKMFAYGKARQNRLKGKLVVPVQGKVTSLFKENGQNGIEISAPMGTEIRATLAGRVLYADWFKGFGNVVILDHGNHMFTVYGYCSKLLKKVGDIVSQSEPIARVGNGNFSKEPALYFELRVQGKPQDPAHWLTGLRK